ncbi:hypothetical protein SDC9_110646 [bioreactor metagenome]|uniref:Peptidoglycan-binding protein n=1 Tax=bioreactor metagenome TaxID=1076179 RepID=A0A645BKL1_9ZZZZ
MKRSIAFTVFILICLISFSQPVVRVPIGVVSSPADAPVHLKLITRIQNYNKTPESDSDFVNEHIDSPKSVNILDSKNKFYIHSLEGCETLVYSLDSFRMIKVIRHSYTAKDSALFHDNTVLGYSFSYKGDVNTFSGKPVESCFTHNKKYLWVTYYRRSFDANAVQPSAIAIIDTDCDSIVRVMPTGPLPKMVAASPDGKYLAVTHWGDNTVGIIDISSQEPADFHYVKHLIVDYKLALNNDNNTPVNRDTECGFCLRGTVFSPDSRYLMVGRMGGGGIAFFDMQNLSYIGTLWGMKSNVRHLTMFGNDLLVSCTRPGYVQKAPVDSLISFMVKKKTTYTAWKDAFVGIGVRTIDVSPDGKYIFSAINNESKITVTDYNTMKVVASVKADSFPVGLAVSENGKLLIVTSQGRNGVGGGNSVMLFSVEY